MDHLLYIDPGSGSYLVQVIVAAALGIVFFFKNLRLYITDLFHRIFKEKKIPLSSAGFQQHPSSYRDPAGFVFTHGGKTYRQVNSVYQPHFEVLVNSGLYQELTSKGLLINHTQRNDNLTGQGDWFTTLEPAALPFISYPYEWSFDMLKDAALHTLSIMEQSLEKGMSLKDASAYNIQFVDGRPLFIDTLSFEKYDATKPWVAYRQFCEHFLAPLAVMHYSKLPLSQLLLAYPEGLPLAMAAAFLPAKTRWNIHLYLHIHLHSRVSSGSKEKTKTQTFSKQKLLNILSSLRSAIRGLQLDYKGTWAAYYEEAEQRAGYLGHKKALVEQWIQNQPYKIAFDAGANDGTFSELLADQKLFVISADSDHFAINALYQKTNKNKLPIQPLLLDLSNPSPSIGVNNSERFSILKRLVADVSLALAVIHHLCIGKNIPFEKTAQFFTQVTRHLIIEFVPKEDEKVQQMLRQKADIYTWYNQAAFEVGYARYFSIRQKTTIKDSVRTLYLMERL